MSLCRRVCVGVSHLYYNQSFLSPCMSFVSRQYREFDRLRVFKIIFVGETSASCNTFCHNDETFYNLPCIGVICNINMSLRKCEIIFHICAYYAVFVTTNPGLTYHYSTHH